MKKGRMKRRRREKRGKRKKKKKEENKGKNEEGKNEVGTARTTRRKKRVKKIYSYLGISLNIKFLFL